MLQERSNLRITNPLKRLNFTVLQARRAAGLAMCNSGAQRQTEQKLVFCEGPSEQRAVERQQGL
ncbi:hypothetical protein SapgrDRAFT_0132 [Saprospira grandis DSM 2844]|uniref:Uncharacterized protein n=1 Tax=Saprospira grandis DSM 2844 TaxID=694433 RepID=J0XSJ3_9BACT|nr:hypothetical protein SapgrDRAFT_0132 [Saprospira grandis DSM 2844]